MKKEFIQNQIRNKIAHELNNGAPKAELKSLTDEIIELCQRHGGEDIPNTELLKVLNNYPDLTGDLVELVRKEYEYAPDETMEAIRHGLNGKM
ncbi:MAG: hypothetical protein WCW31_00975 [Patescibacteria group bacterium]|jgi:hypothetical protein